MKISNTEVYGIRHSIIRSAYPKTVDFDTVDFSRDLTELDWRRAKSLGNATPGSGHDCFLKGIHVQADFTAPQYFWQQWKRYHFADIISSQSTMHKMGEFDLKAMCTEQTDPRIVAITEEYIFRFNNGTCDMDTLLSNTPQGLQLTAAVETNYLQIKSMRAQREHHKLMMWNKVFVNWVDGLPQFTELCCNG